MLPYLRTSQAAELIGVSPKTMYRYAVDRRLPSLVTSGGHRRFRRSDVEALVRRPT